MNLTLTAEGMVHVNRVMVRCASMDDWLTRPCTLDAPAVKYIKKKKSWRRQLLAGVGCLEGIGVKNRNC